MAVRRTYVKAYLEPVRMKVQEWTMTLEEVIKAIEDRDGEAEWQSDLLSELEELKFTLDNVIERCDDV